MADDFDFKTLSLNVRGLGKTKKRISVFRWLKERKSDIVFLQETHITDKVVNTYKHKRKWPMFCSNGASNSKGVAILSQNFF
jgi:exonuclease III